MEQPAIRLQPDPKTCPVQTQAEIHIFKPQWEVALVKPLKAFPYFFLDQQTGTGRLLDLLRLTEIKIQATILCIDRIVRPNPVDSENFEGQGGEVGKAAH